MQQDSSIKDIISSSLEQIRTIVDANTVLGNQIVTPSGTVIIPVSKISMGFATGGLDFGKKKDPEGKKPNNYGGGGGTGVTVTPVAFLILSPEGKIDLIPVTDAKNVDTVDKISALIERSPDILKRLKDVLVKKKEEKDEKKD